MKKLLLALGILALICSPAMAGRNANGAMVLHENDAITYSLGWDYCANNALPATCGELNTTIGRDPGIESVIWVVAAFMESASPGVTAYQFGIYGDVPADYYSAMAPCGPGALEIPDATWPAPGTGTAVAYTSAVYSRLFKMYWFAAGSLGPGSAIATGHYPNGPMVAQFADDSNPPQVDDVYHFGRAVWGGAGLNDCPVQPTQGACCYPDGHCEFVDQTACQGVFQGVGVLCDPNPCPPPRAACCFVDGSCADLLEADCAAQGGTWEGFGTACATFACPQPQPEACCFQDGSCQNLLAADCTAQGGTPEGAGTSCETFTCPQPPTGACCIEGACTVTTQADCAGQYMGDGTVCDPNPCATATKSTTWGKIKGNYR